MGSFIDLTGHVYGQLTCIRPDGGSNAFGSRKWLCRCNCGAEKVVSASSIRNGKTTSCGCVRARSLLGQTFGLLIVIGRSKKRKKTSRSALWDCRCACGNTVNAVASYSLVSGNTRSCGCIVQASSIRNGERRLIDLSGQRFGRLLVESRCGTDKHGGPVWSCVCSCGAITKVRGSCLRYGLTVSCGCLVSEGGRERPERVILKASVAGAMRRARRYCASGKYTDEEIQALYIKQRAKCVGPGCGIALQGRFHKDHIVALSKGGSNWISNIQLLCQPCNQNKHAKDPVVWANERGMLL